MIGYATIKTLNYSDDLLVYLGLEPSVVFFLPATLHSISALGIRACKVIQFTQEGHHKGVSVFTASYEWLMKEIKDYTPLADKERSEVLTAYKEFTESLALIIF